MITLIPALVILGLSIDPTLALVLSQVALSIALPFPMVALVGFASRRRIMGVFTISRPVTALAVVAALVVLALNTLLLLDTFGIVSL